MKILSSIFQLQDQISFCPLCQKKNRHVFTANVSAETKVVHYREKDNKIKMRVHTDNSKSPKKVITYDIDTHSNDFDFVLYEKQPSPPNLNFLIIGKCPENHANSAGSFVLNAGNKKIENIFYNKETISISDNKCSYRISMLYHNDVLLVSSLDDPNHKVHSFPLMELDFSQPQKILTKIKTLLLFS